MLTRRQLVLGTTSVAIGSTLGIALYSPPPFIEESIIPLEVKEAPLRPPTEAVTVRYVTGIRLTPKDVVTVHHPLYGASSIRNPLTQEVFLAREPLGDIDLVHLEAVEPRGIGFPLAMRVPTKTEELAICYANRHTGQIERFLSQYLNVVKVEKQPEPETGLVGLRFSKTGSPAYLIHMKGSKGIPIKAREGMSGFPLVAEDGLVGVIVGFGTERKGTPDEWNYAIAAPFCYKNDKLKAQVENLCERVI